MYNCTLIGNVSKQGGGADGGILRNCMLITNWANDGGAASYSRLLNCTVIGNFATNQGGGTVGGILTNCIVYDNTSPNGANWVDGTNSNYCCTTPLPLGGTANFTNLPGFIDEAAGNFRLQASSPCINSGNNLYVGTSTDLDGLPRIVAGTVDVGVYEFQGSGSLISYAWLQEYGLPTDGSADFADTDGDGMNNWQEWICGTDPIDAASFLEMLSPVPRLGGVVVPWLSVTNRNYFLQRASDLSGQPAFVTLGANIPGQFGTTTFVDTNLTSGVPFFYRVGTQR